MSTAGNDYDAVGRIEGRNRVTGPALSGCDREAA